MAEIVRATGDDTKSKTADIRLTVLDHGQQAKQLPVKLLIDSGVYRTLLSEEDWQRVQASGTNRTTKLKNNKVRFVPEVRGSG